MATDKRSQVQALYAHQFPQVTGQFPDPGADLKIICHQDAPPSGDRNQALATGSLLLGLIYLDWMRKHGTEGAEPCIQAGLLEIKLVTLDRLNER